MLLALLAACGTITAGQPASSEPEAPVEPGEDPKEAAEEEDSYIAEEDPIQPSLTLDEVASAISAAALAARAVDGATLFDAYDQAMSGRSSTCPYTNEDYQTYYGYDYWYDDCTAESGARYSGYGLGYHYVDWWSDSATYYRDYGYWYGNAKVTRADGAELVASGYAYFYDYDQITYGYSGYYADLFGEFRSTAPEHGSTWLADGISVSYTVSRYYYGMDPGQLQLVGGISHIDGLVNAVVFDGVYALSAYHGSQCTAEPGGTISVREESGEWYDVSFHGPIPGSTISFPADCDGCGEVYFRGDYLGQICPDLTTLLNWGA